MCLICMFTALLVYSGSIINVSLSHASVNKLEQGCSIG